MNSCGFQQARDEMKRSSVVVSSVPDRRNVVVCPKPRRVGVHHLARSHRWQSNQQSEVCDSNSASEILDLILAKGGVGVGGGGEQDRARAVRSSPSPPLFFTGSPPSRVSNPLTKDSLFKEELLMVAPATPRGATKPQPPPSPRNGGGGCVTNFGNSPAVRVVGFNCGLDRDRRSSIPTLA